jgi:hypothetical protein
MKYTTLSVRIQLCRNARVRADERAPSPSQFAQHFISAVHAPHRLERTFPLRDTNAKMPDYTFTTGNSAQKPTSALQSSAPNPTI